MLVRRSSRVHLVQLAIYHVATPCLFSPSKDFFSSVLKISRNALFPEGIGKIRVKFSKLLLSLRTWTYNWLTTVKPISFPEISEGEFELRFTRSWVNTQSISIWSQSISDSFMCLPHSWYFLCLVRLLQGMRKRHLGFDREPRRGNALKAERRHAVIWPVEEVMKK